MEHGMKEDSKATVEYVQKSALGIAQPADWDDRITDKQRKQEKREMLLHV
jgi:hypothetical protein